MTNDLDQPKRLGFTVSPGEPDELDVELWSIGAVPASAEPRIRELAVGPQRALLADLEAHKTWFRLAHRPLGAPVVRRWVFAGAAAQAVAAAAALFARQLGPVAAPEPTEVRAMGGLPVDLVVRRDGQVMESGTWRAGDELFVRFVAPADGVVRVITVQADGALSVLEPGRRVRSGERFVLDGAARLDDHAGREWLVATLDDHPLDDDDAAAQVRSWLPDPGAHPGPRRWIREITRSP
jgi:hypothetical protein